LSQEARLLKESPQRRLVREARSGPPVDLVVAMEESGGFVRVGPYSDVLEEQEMKERKEKAEQFVLRCSPEQQQALRHLLERHQRGEDGMSLLELLQAIGAVPVSVRRKQELEREDLNLYKGLGRLLNDLKGMVVITRIPGEGQGYSLRYALNGAGARWLEQVLEG
ncbi:MAG: hypothetical protein ACKOPS_12370, partial [Cyanobium sp.]